MCGITDFFSFGLDLVAPVRIRSLIYNRVLPEKPDRLQLGIVYDYGAIKILASGDGMRRDDLRLHQRKLERFTDLARQWFLSESPIFPIFLPSIQYTSNGFVNHTTKRLIRSPEYPNTPRAKAPC